MRLEAAKAKVLDSVRELAEAEKTAGYNKGFAEGFDAGKVEGNTVGKRDLEAAYDKGRQVEKRSAKVNQDQLVFEFLQNYGIKVIHHSAGYEPHRLQITLACGSVLDLHARDSK